jgi:hypothetical protein
MFELLSNLQSVPIDPDSLTMVHRGMNKVRVSVGEHSSEPSEVYIITGQSNGNLESYIIFYMLEPGIHVVYGSDKNPFAPTLIEQVIEEAIIFVEEMGSILEEVPWETMTPDQRSAWVEKEILYSAPVIDELEEVEEIEAVEVVQLEDVAMEEAGLEEGFVEVSDDEVRQALSENDSVESLDMSEDIDGDDVDAVDAAGMDDVVVAEGDFDELLKQAFLKPDVAAKTKLKKGKKKDVKVEEQPVPGETYEDEIEDVMVQEETELSGAGESFDDEEKLEIPGEPEEAVKVEIDLTREEKTVDTVEVSQGASDSALPEKDTRLNVIRFLSRF